MRAEIVQLLPSLYCMYTICCMFDDSRRVRALCGRSVGRLHSFSQARVRGPVWIPGVNVSLAVLACEALKYSGSVALPVVRLRTLSHRRTDAKDMNMNMNMKMSVIQVVSFV
jgi:hypothetical protein